MSGLRNPVKVSPRPVVLGFTNGIALLIASTQIKDLLGLRVSPVPSEFFSRMAVLGPSLPTFNATAVPIALAALAVILVVPRVWPRIPGSIVAVVLATLAVGVFGLAVET